MTDLAAERLESKRSKRTPALHDFYEDVVRGLSARPRRLPCKYFYDARGSALFDRICELDAYYPTRTELGILRSCASEIATRIGPHARIFELGSGSGNKTRALLAALHEPSSYVPIDISREPLRDAAEAIANDFPRLEVVPMHADYMQVLTLPQQERAYARTVAYFPGSTIGNLEPGEATQFLARLRGLVGKSGALVLGVDLKKDPAILHRAYNDPEGVTAAFNANLLERINRELDGRFDVSRFRHYALYEPVAGRIEMHLVSVQAQVVAVGERTFSFDVGDTIVTEHSYKYAPREIAAMAERAGFAVEALYTDPRGLFSVHYLGAR